MQKYKCKTCGKLFRPDKNEICPRCGDAVSPTILRQLERARTEARFLSEEREGHDPHCHEDDAWSGSHGDKVYHSVSNRNTGGTSGAASGGTGSASGGNPTRLSNANPYRTNSANPTRLSNANPNRTNSANPTRLSNANPYRTGGTNPYRSRANNRRNVQAPVIVKIIAGLFAIFWLFLFLGILFGFLTNF